LIDSLAGFGKRRKDGKINIKRDAQRGRKEDEQREERRGGNYLRR